MKCITRFYLKARQLIGKTYSGPLILDKMVLIYIMNTYSGILISDKMVIIYILNSQFLQY